MYSGLCRLPENSENWHRSGLSVIHRLLHVYACRIRGTTQRCSAELRCMCCQWQECSYSGMPGRLDCARLCAGVNLKNSGDSVSRQSGQLVSHQMTNTGTALAIALLWREGMHVPCCSLHNTKQLREVLQFESDQLRLKLHHRTGGCTAVRTASAVDGVQVHFWAR